jgi:ABC-2 type transport system ATP-binding protein
MLIVRDVTKAYGDIQALGGISLDVAAGEIVGLLGPNGAGKTTSLKIITGYLEPDSGSVTVDGLDVHANLHAVQAQIGYLPESAPLYPELSVQDYLRMMATLRQIPEEEQPLCLSEAIHATGLAERLAQPIGTLSKGFRQRVGVAQAILARPKLLILDEPTIGLDPTQIVEMRKLIRRLAEHSTILFSTHILSEVEALCDRAIILMNGLVKADARLAELESTPNAILVLDKATEGVEAALKGLPGVTGVERQRGQSGRPAYRVLGKAGAADGLCPAIYNLARQRDWPLRELRHDARTLEAVFNELATVA